MSPVSFDVRTQIKPPSQPVLDPWVERLAQLMDSSVRVGRWSFGLDPILGLVPGIGDAISGFISLALVVRAVQLRVPKSAVARMMVNIGLDTVIGAVPILGSIFDFAYKANTRNVIILREALAGARSARRDWAIVAAVIGFALLLASVPVIVAILLIRAYWPGWL